VSGVAVGADGERHPVALGVVGGASCGVREDGIGPIELRQADLLDAADVELRVQPTSQDAVRSLDDVGVRLGVDQEELVEVLLDHVAPIFDMRGGVGTVSVHERWVASAVRSTGTETCYPRLSSDGADHATGDAQPMAILTVNGVALAYEEAGDGPALVLLHAGIVDHRMWADVLPDLARDFRVIAPDLRGYGDTPLPDGPFVYAADVVALLDALGIEKAHIVGVSMSGSVAIDLALAHPDRVDRLVIVGAGISGWDYSPEMDAANAVESAALEAGDLDEASWVNVRTWLDGPTRSAGDVDPELRRRVFEMQRRAFDWENDKAEGGWLVADRRGRMGEITAPTLVMVGDLDQRDMVEIAPVIAEAIPGATLHVLRGVAHLPPMEDPAGFLAPLREFLLAR